MRAGEIVTVDVYDLAGTETVRTQVMSSHPVITDGRLQYELHLEMVIDGSPRTTNDE